MLSNNVVKFEKLHAFLWLYRRSLDKDFKNHDDLLRLSKKIAEIGDDEYESSPNIVKRIIDVVRLYEFDMILSNRTRSFDADFEKFWTFRIATKVSQITNPTNSHQRLLIYKAKEYIARHKQYIS